MKNILLSALFLLAISATAQTISTEEPQWPGDIVYANDSVGKGIDLERQEASIKSKASASMYVVGMGKVTTVCSVHGLASPVRIPKKQTVQFVYKFKSNDVNPKEVITIYPMQIKKDTRVIEIGSTGSFSGATVGDMKTLDYKAVKYGTASYLITITGYEPGEYAFSLGEGTTRVLYLFGIDR